MKLIFFVAVCFVNINAFATTTILNCSVNIFDEEKRTTKTNQKLKLSVEVTENSKILIFNDDEYPVIFASNFKQAPIIEVKDLSTQSSHHLITKLELPNKSSVESNMILTKDFAVLSYKYFWKSNFSTWEISVDGRCSK